MAWIERTSDREALLCLHPAQCRSLALVCAGPVPRSDSRVRSKSIPSVVGTSERKPSGNRWSAFWRWVPTSMTTWAGWTRFLRTGRSEGQHDRRFSDGQRQHHGTGLLQCGHARARRHTLWEGGHRVPCFIRWPDGPLGRRATSTHLSHVQDLLPTLADLGGISPAPAELGRRESGADLSRRTQVAGGPHAGDQLQSHAPVQGDLSRRATRPFHNAMERRCVVEALAITRRIASSTTSEGSAPGS